MSAAVTSPPPSCREFRRRMEGAGGRGYGQGSHLPSTITCLAIASMRLRVTYKISGILGSKPGLAELHHTMTNNNLAPFAHFIR